jgi:hypothetical protein
MDMILLFQKITRRVIITVTLFSMLLIAPATYAAPAQNPAPGKTTPAKNAFPANYKSPLGINTNEALEVDSSLPFVDLFRLALPFDEARPWFTKGKVKFDKQGWPTDLNGGKAGTRFLSHIPAKALPQGIYTVLYDGEGIMRYGASAKLIERSPGKDLINIKPMPDGAITATLFIEHTNTDNPLRNIRIFMPGGICANNPLRTVKSEKNCARGEYRSFAEHGSSIVFNPDYMNFMKDFKVVRFMNMGGVTRNNVRFWKDRPHLDKATWGGKEGVRGIPLEIMVTLANRLKINPWFNIPHNADYNYIHQFAQFVKKNLDPSLTVYLEYSNETWNNVFVPQAEHMKQTGYKQGLDKDRNIAGTKYYALQSVRIFKIWEKVFGSTSRLVRVLGGMTTDMRLTSTLLGYKNTYKNVDAVAIGPYFHIPQSQMKDVHSVNDVFKFLEAKDNRYSIKNILKFVKQQADITRDYGVDLIAYEGGQHLVDHKTHSMKEGATPFLYQANRDPRMGQAYYRLLNGWKKAGGKLFVAFSSPRPSTWHGSWGIKEYISQNLKETPKYRALLGFAHNQPCWWQGCETGTLVRHKKPRRIPTSLVTGIKPNNHAHTTVKLFKNDRKTHTLHSARAQNIGNLIKGTINNNKDLSGRWRATWDDNNLMLWVSIIDDKNIKDSKKTWADDSIELYFDTDASRNAKYDGKNDFSISFRRGDKIPKLSSNITNIDVSKIKHQINKYIWGYQFTASIPWKVLGIKPHHGKRIGFDIQVNDDDTGGSRDAKITWNAKSDMAWSNPQMFGEIMLVDAAAPLRPDADAIKQHAVANSNNASADNMIKDDKKELGIQE